LTIQPIRVQCKVCGQTFRCKSSKFERIKKQAEMNAFKVVLNKTALMSTVAKPVYEGVCVGVKCVEIAAANRGKNNGNG